jgi:manganese/zinc/iron transport system permease protein
MNSLAEFLSFADPNVRYVTLGALLITASSALVGSFSFLNKKSLTGDAIAHAVLPGVCLGFILSGTKNPLYLIAGAFVTGWLSVQVIQLIVTRSRIKEDTAIGIVLSVFFGIGILLLTIIQKSGNASQSGLDHFLFGKAAALVGKDLIAFSVVAIVLVATVLLFFKEFKLVVFDRNYAQALGLPVKRIELILTSMVVLAVVIGIQTVGVVLMAAVLITPAAAAKFWTDSIKTMLVLAFVIGALCGVIGAYISYTAPSMPTGPWIVITVSTFTLLSFLLAPKKGIINKLLKQRRFQQTIQDENVLKAIYQLGEENNEFFVHRYPDEIIRRRKIERERLLISLKRLLREGYIERTGNQWALTQEGKSRAQRIVKIHRLWELYLTTHVNIAPDHVHDEAETIEHFLTPELEAELEQVLNYPKTDPHQTTIPYQ